MRFAAEVGFIIAGAIGASICVALLAARLPAASRLFDQRLGPRVSTQLWPAQLVRLEHAVEWSASSASAAHTGLRPVLVEIAEARLHRRGLRLDRDAAEVRQLLGPAAWELVRPDRPAPASRDAPGIGARELGEILDALEAL